MPESIKETSPSAMAAFDRILAREEARLGRKLTPGERACLLIWGPKQ